jgi:hypothetical protein
MRRLINNAEYNLLHKYLSLYIYGSDRFVSVHPTSDSLLRLFTQGPDDELIIIEGNSTDDTWEAMRFFNIVGNKFFAQTFSFILGQKFKVTPHGTKLLSRANYEKLAGHWAYFGDFVIFGSALICLKIVEVSVR